MNLDIVLSGVGGQGIIVLGDIFCEAAILDGFDAAKAEIHGMAQRGGSITAHIRIGDRVQSPLIERGKSDIIVGFEILETARALPMLKDKGIVIMNMKYIPVTGLQEAANHISLDEIMRAIRKKANRVYEVDATAIANNLGNILVANTVLLGALSAIHENPVRTESFEKAMTNRMKEKYVKINLKAFNAGRECVLMG